MKEGTYFKYSDSSLGVIDRVFNGVVQAYILPECTLVTIPTDIVAQTIIPQEIETSQCGVLRLFDSIQVNSKIEDPYILQLVAVDDNGCSFIRHDGDETGLLNLHSNDLLQADRELVQLTKLDSIQEYCD